MVAVVGAAPRVLFTPRTILIVDDHIDSADVIAEVLELHGHETRVAYEPLRALSVAAEFRPQVAILDIELPTMDGYELGALLRRDLPECQFVGLTGSVGEAHGLRGKWAGFHAHLTKPVGLDELLAAVSEVRQSGTFARDPHAERFREPTPRRPRERGRIDLHESPEVVRYWTTELGCSEAQLRAAVNAVGISSEDVRRHLKR